MSKSLAFAKQVAFMLIVSAITSLVGLLSLFTYNISQNDALISQPINFEPVVALDQVGEDQFDMRIVEHFSRTVSTFPNRYITKIEASPNDTNMVYVTSTMASLEVTNEGGLPLLWTLITLTIGIATSMLFFLHRKRDAYINIRL